MTEFEADHSWWRGTNEGFAQIDSSDLVTGTEITSLDSVQFQPAN